MDSSSCIGSYSHWADERGEKQAYGFLTCFCCAETVYKSMEEKFTTRIWRSFWITLWWCCMAKEKISWAANSHHYFSFSFSLPVATEKIQNIFGTGQGAATNVERESLHYRVSFVQTLHTNEETSQLVTKPGAQNVIIFPKLPISTYKNLQMTLEQFG